MKRLLWGIGLTAIIGTAAVFWIRVDVSAAPTELTLASVSRGDVIATVEATGTLQPLDTVEVGTQVSGIIASLGTDFNQLVKRRQIIARLDQAIFQSQVDQARATTIRLTSDVDQAQVQLEDAQLKLKRAEQLAAAQLLAQQDVDTARSAARIADAGLTGAKAQLSQAEAALTQATLNLSHTVIASPTDGIVLSRNVEVGQTVSAGLQAPTLFVIARDLTRLELQARVDESDVGGVEPGAKAVFTVDAYPRKQFSGIVRLVRLQPQTVQNVVTYTTIVDVPNADGQLRPGMTSTVSIELARADNALRVPTTALRFQPSAEVLTHYPADATITDGSRRQPAVWQLVDGRLREIPVSAGVSDGTQVAITTDALVEGAQVVTGIVRAERTAAAAPATGSPLVPSLPRRPQASGGGAPQGRQ